MSRSIEHPAHALRLRDEWPELERLLTVNADPPPRFAESEIGRKTLNVVMRDGIRLATDLYLPPLEKAPTIIERTPYGRRKRPESLTGLSRQGYVVVVQDCRGTGDSEPNIWDYYVHEPDDSFDTVEWASQQPWYDGFLAGCGGSYLASTQWCMAAHPLMSTIVPEVGGLGVEFSSARLYMFLNAYVRSVGKGAGKIAASYTEIERDMLAETLAGGYFNDSISDALSGHLLALDPALASLPIADAKRAIWQCYVSASPTRRLELLKQILKTDGFSYEDMEHLVSGFGQGVAIGAHSIPHACAADLAAAIRAPALIVSGWYDWNLGDTLASWNALMRDGQDGVRMASRLLITPSAHNKPGYHEGEEAYPELRRNFRTPDITGILLHWYQSARAGNVADWPKVIYYLMGANEWRSATAWPPPESRPASLYLAPNGALTLDRAGQAAAQTYIYDPTDPTPTVGGSIVSAVYPPGSADVSDVQTRGDVIVFTTPPLATDLDVVGPLRVILYASSTAVDTDFVARLSDVFPDGRALQLQNGILRTRYRKSSITPELMEPGTIYELEIDMWATANRFLAGHRLRVDICSADFPRFDRNANRGGEPGPPSSAAQTVHFGAGHPSRLIISVMGPGPICFGETGAAKDQM